ncbi:MAG: hypothetical protein FXF47_06040 [Candidatus Mcinerneyibacterium aminivorans]|uniref:DUF5673 domain-containing protein n=1 Tax=Candidatus Mcinerneyibacterium aminivorans TaxID=2703815 RepID=A0A5D0MEZ3_9BACT|nr:MAG: hypothetical protein FXF47_06040 [Candidatus Mcinerneyibacterium aminivorans]
MVKILFSLFFFGCILFFSIKTKMWEKNTLDKFKIKGALFVKIIVIIGFIISIYFFITTFILKGYYTKDDIYSFLYLIMLLLFMSHLTFGKFVITEKGIIYKGRFVSWFDITDYSFEQNEIYISYKGTIENEISFKLNKKDLDKIDYYFRTRVS